MYCTNCGEKMEDGSKFCTNCGAQIESKNETTQAVKEKNVKEETIQKVEEKNINVEDENKKANRLCILSVILFFGAPIIDLILYSLQMAGLDSFFTSTVIELLSLGEPASIILMIYVRVKYPKNKFGKIIMWIYIILIALGIIIGVVFIIILLYECRGSNL